MEETNKEEIEDPKEEPVEKSKLEILKEENDDYEKELIRSEELRAKRQIGGDTEAGQTKPEPKEETDKEYSDRIDKEISEGKFNG